MFDVITPDREWKFICLFISHLPCFYYLEEPTYMGMNGNQDVNMTLKIKKWSNFNKVMK